MRIFGARRDGGWQRGPADLFANQDAAVIEASDYNRDISFAFGAQTRLREAEKELLENLGESAAPDGRGFSDSFISELDKAYQGVLGEAPSARAGEMASVLTADMRRRARDKALVFEADRRGSFFKNNLEDSIAAARDEVLSDPEGAVEIYSGLLGALSLAANGWLGRNKGKELARTLKKELFEDAARALIDQDPSGALDKLGGLFGDNLATDDRTRFAEVAKRRVGALAEDARAQDRRIDHKARLDAITTRARDLATLTEAAERGEVTRAGLDSLLGQRRITKFEHESLSNVLSIREQDEESRHAAIERVEAFLDSKIGVGKADEGFSFDRPDAEDVELWWQGVFVPSLERLDPESRARREDRMAAILGTVPAALARDIRAGLYGKDPAAIIAAAARVVAMTAMTGGGGPSFTQKEIAVSAGITNAAQALPDPELAVRKFALERGIDREAEVGIADLLLTMDDDEETSQSLDGTPDKPVLPGKEGSENDRGILEREDIDDETDRELGEILRQALNDAQSEAAAEGILDREDIDDITDQELGAILRRGLNEAEIDLTDFDAFADEDSDQKAHNDTTAARRRRRKITGFGDLAAGIDRSLEGQEDRPSIEEISRAQGQFFPVIGEIMAVADAVKAFRRAKEAQARGDIAAAREARKEAALAIAGLIPVGLFNPGRIAARILARGERLRRNRPGPITDEELRALEERLRRLHGKRAPKRKETIAEKYNHWRMQREINHLRTARETLEKGTTEYNRLLHAQRGLQLSLNKSKANIFERTMARYISRKLGRKLRRMGYDFDTRKRRYVVGRRAAYDDGGVTKDGVRVGPTELKQGRAGKRASQEWVQLEAVERDGMMRVFAPEGRKIEVTGTLDLNRILQAERVRNGN